MLKTNIVPQTQIYQQRCSVGCFVEGLGDLLEEHAADDDVLRVHHDLAAAAARLQLHCYQHCTPQRTER